MRDAKAAKTTGGGPMKTAYFALAKQCIPLLGKNNEPTDLLLWVIVPLGALLIVPPIWRLLTGGQTRAEANLRGVGVPIVVCLILLVVGWLGSQFLDPIC